MHAHLHLDALDVGLQCAGCYKKLLLNLRVRYAARDRQRSVVIERQGRLAAEVAGLGGRMKRLPHETPAARNARHATLL